MGTPDFAVPALATLVENGYDVVGVITATDKFGGRGKNKLIESAVKKYAREKNLRILQPEKLKAPDFLQELQSLKADLQVVVAFRMLPEVVWNMPPIGTINLHASLLPKYRGAAPINWAIMEGETETGVTTFFLQHEIDTGDLLLQESLPIYPNETAGELHDRLMQLGAETVLKSVRLIENGTYSLQPQDDKLVCKAPKIFREDCEINFQQSSQQVYNFIRGLSPYPTAWTEVEGLQMKIYQAAIHAADSGKPPGQLISDNKEYLRFATTDGQLDVLELQLEGRKRMNTKAFLNGYQLKNIEP
ncbi:MAG: methionyl-tRNA formyltransferase [Saprospiraceae bacterium]|nr:methionyl-tRNA formyltransferase [Saprospiraceae bacterium]